MCSAPCSLCSRGVSQLALESELKELRDRVMLAERSSGAREDSLQKELASLRERWQAAEVCAVHLFSLVCARTLCMYACM